MTENIADKLLKDKIILDKINEVIDQYIRPNLNADGGDISVVDFYDNILFVELLGACNGCYRARMTLENVVGSTIHHLVSPDITIKLV